MKKSTKNIGIIVLAAGASKRLGKPKQLLYFRGETLLKRAAKIAAASGCQPVIVVLGANTENLAREIEEFDVEIVENLDWENGMGTSIQSGLKRLLEICPDISGVIITVGDQPLVSVELIRKLTASFRLSDVPIVACSYGDAIGVPALFSRRILPELSALEADTGARKIIYRYRESVFKIPFEAGAVDVDTERDYLNLIESSEKNFEK